MRVATMAAAVVRFAGGLLAAPAVHAGDLATVVCVGSDAASYSPGLRSFRSDRDIRLNARRGTPAQAWGRSAETTRSPEPSAARSRYRAHRCSDQSA